MCNKICQHLENVYILVNQYLQNGQFMMVQNHAWVKTKSCMGKLKPSSFGVASKQEYPQ